MSSKHDAIEEIAEVLDTLNEIISKYELEDEFAYVFCCAVPVATNVFETEYTAGYSWSTEGKKEFDAIITILENAYHSRDDGKWELLNNISLN
tara:strand:+ start:628 stop:906 length:279 start_codon:yes stop_codon:yes gene_type:complete